MPALTHMQHIQDELIMERALREAAEQRIQDEVLKRIRAEKERDMYRVCGSQCCLTRCVFVSYRHCLFQTMLPEVGVGILMNARCMYVWIFSYNLLTLCSCCSTYTYITYG